MNIINDIIITDKDIDWVEKLMGDDIKFDSTRREAIKRMNTLDVQAFPGTGKTTILVAKLAILAKKWNNPNSGICILSHTNVAREEIEERLGTSEIGGKLLAFPHFVGTIHSFFTTYLALPWIKSKGISPEIIDKEVVLGLRRKAYNFYYPSYVRFLSEKKYIDKIEYYEKIGKINLEIGTDTQSYKNIIDILERSHDAGYYTYNEVLLYAKEAISLNPKIKDYISSRFPIVLIDEAQDNDNLQNFLIDNSFRSSIVQRFGDENQAIYEKSEIKEDNNFPKKDHITINKSKRFNSKMATLSEPLSLFDEILYGDDENILSNKPE